MYETPFDRHPVKDSGEYPTVGRVPNGTDLDGRPARGARRNPTTSFLTATTLIYAIRAGITAAAGTRLAL